MAKPKPKRPVGAGPGPPPLTAHQGKNLFREWAKEEARGDVKMAILLRIFLPFLMKLLERFFEQFLMVPKESGRAA